MQDADPPIRQLPGGLAMGLVALAARRSRPSRPATDDRTEGPLVESAGQALVAAVASEHYFGFARGFGHRRRAGVVLARLGVGVAVRVIPELAQHPGAQDRPHPWKRVDDLGARVLFKMLRQRRFEFGDLGVHLRDGPRARGSDLAVGVLEDGGLRELLSAQRFLDFLGALVEVALSSSTFQRRDQLGARQRSTDRRGRCHRQNRDGVHVR